LLVVKIIRKCSFFKKYIEIQFILGYDINKPKGNR
jgi:hypothetical protein